VSALEDNNEHIARHIGSELTRGATGEGVHIHLLVGARPAEAREDGHLDAHKEIRCSVWYSTFVG
jgi:hypothetical protein